LRGGPDFVKNIINTLEQDQIVEENQTVKQEIVDQETVKQETVKQETVKQEIVDQDQNRITNTLYDIEKNLLEHINENYQKTFEEFANKINKYPE
jgi:hypothetical protein